MRTFRFTFHIEKSSFSVAKPYIPENGIIKYVFPIGDSGSIIVTLSDNKDIVEEVPIHRGLSAEVESFGDDLDSALKEAESRLQAILSLAVFQSNTTVGEVYLVFGCETTPQAETTEFIQMEYYAGDLIQRKRALDPNKLVKINEAFFANTNTNVAIAIRWYRKGLTEDDQFDQFLSYWAGLEYLNNSLVSLLGGKPEVRKCKKCGEQYNVPSSKGIGALFAKYSVNGEEDFKHCRDMSVALRHGSIRLNEALLSVYPLAELCRAMLSTGICLLLNLSPEDYLNNEQPVYNTHLPRIEHRGTYDISPDKVPNAPPLQISGEISSVTYTDEKRKISCRSNVQRTIPVPFSYTSRYIAEAGIEIQATNAQQEVLSSSGS
jgi:hypothetical protein